MKQHFYHYGISIKKYREAHGWTQAKLAGTWLRSDGGRGVNTRYIQDIEYGVKRIDDPTVLRDVSALLDIPLWEIGLSEYNPFDPVSLPGHGKRMFDETLNVVEVHLSQTFAMRRVASLPQVEKSAAAITRLFVYFQTHTPPSSRLEHRFLSLLGQEQQLRALMHFEHDDYAEALRLGYVMLETGKEANDAVLQIQAMQKIGVEQKRLKNHALAVEALEKARDLSFETSRHVQAHTHAYLSHIYAAAGDALRFERASEMAQRFAAPLGDSYGDGTDFVFHKMSGILQLRSRGYLRTGQPQKAIDLHDEVRRQVYADSNMWLDFRLDLYRARAYLMLNDLHSCIGATREFFDQVRGWGSPHRLTRGVELLEEIEAKGYGNEKAVREFREDLMTAMQQC